MDAPLAGRMRWRCSSRRGNTVLTRYLLLFTLLFLGWGVISPFMPVVLASQGATAAQIGLLLSLAMVVRLVAMPVAGLWADRRDAPRQMLATGLMATAAVTLCLGWAQGMAWLLPLMLLQALVVAPVGPLPDALAVRAAATPAGKAGRMDYGLVRGVGSGCFVVGSAIGGVVMAASGGLAVLALHAGCFALAAIVAWRLPPPASGPVQATPPAFRRAWRALAALLPFRRLLLVSALIQGSHAFYAGFAVLGWRQAGIDDRMAGLLWALAVAAEVLVFAGAGRYLLRALGAGGLCVLAATAGVLRWSILAMTESAVVLALAQPLHGLTFAAQHLAAMAIIAQVAPPQLSSFAQAVLAALGPGLATAVLLLLSGPLFSSMGPAGYWAMAALCALALPIAWSMAGATLPAREAA